MLDWFRGRNNAETGPRDGEAPVLERMALFEGESPAEVPAQAQQVLGPRELQRDLLLRTLSAKVLNVHLANRYQTSYPLVLNFQALAPDEAALLVEIAAAALLADPRSTLHAEAARSRILEANGTDADMATFEAALRQPRALCLILQEIVSAGLSSHAYAVSLIALGRPTSTGRHYLAYLAARLGLGEEIVGSLKRRYQH